MKEVGTSAESMDEFIKEVPMLDTFRCEPTVHFYGACTIPNHLMLVMEYAPCGPLAACIRRWTGLSDEIKAKILVAAAKGLRTSQGTASTTWTSSRTTSFSSRWMKCSARTGS